MKEKKNIQKSVRMTKTVYNFIIKQSGKGFNEKFENAVLKLLNKEKELDKKIASKEEYLALLSERETNVSELLDKLDFISKQVDYIHSNLQKYKS